MLLFPKTNAYLYNNKYYDVISMDILSEEFKSDLIDKKIDVQ